MTAASRITACWKHATISLIIVACFQHATSRIGHAPHTALTSFVSCGVIEISCLRHGIKSRPFSDELFHTKLLNALYDNLLLVFVEQQTEFQSIDKSSSLNLLSRIFNVLKSGPIKLYLMAKTTTATIYSFGIHGNAFSSSLNAA